MLIVAYEGTDEVKVVNKTGLNHQYEHCFHQNSEMLTQVFNRFNCLVNDMHRLNMNKTRNSSVLKFLVSHPQTRMAETSDGG